MAAARAAEARRTMVEWPREKKKPTEMGRRPLLHELAHHVVDGRDMVRVHRVAEAEEVGQKGRPQ